MEVPGRQGREVHGSTNSDDIHCNPCQLDSRQVKAKGYCQICGEYLCSTCVDYHRRFKISQSHRILSPSKMQIAGSKRFSTVTSGTEPCELHTDEVIKFYCHGHDSVCCSVCATLNHRTCKINFIPDIAKNFKKSKEYRAFKESLSQFDVRMDELHQHIQDVEKTADETSSLAVNGIWKFRKEIKEYLDQAEEEMLARGKQLNSANQETLRGLKDRHADIRHKFNEIKRQLEECEDEVTQLFIKTKRFGREYAKITTEHEELSVKAKVQQFSFQPSDRLLEIVRSKPCFGELHSVRSEQYGTIKGAGPSNSVGEQHDITNMSLTLTGKICVKYRSDWKQSWITGMTLLTADKLLMVDYTNDSLKLVDISNGTVTASLMLQGGLRDVTALPNDQAAVTVWNNREIQIVSSRGNKLTAVRQFTVNGLCRGICCCGDKLIVTYLFPVKIEILCMDGTVCRTVSTDRQGNNIFSSPLYVTVHNSDTESKVYVSGYNTKRIIKLTVDGETTSHFTEESLTSTHGLAALDTNHLAVCSYDKNEITVVNIQEEKMAIVKQWSCVERPNAMVFCPENNTLYVSSRRSGESDKIHVYKLSSPL